MLLFIIEILFSNLSSKLASCMWAAVRVANCGNVCKKDNHSHEITGISRFTRIVEQTYWRSHGMESESVGSSLVIFSSQSVLFMNTITQALRPIISTMADSRDCPRVRSANAAMVHLPLLIMLLSFFICSSSSRVIPWTFRP